MSGSGETMLVLYAAERLGAAAVEASDPTDRCEDALKDIVPEERRRPYDMRRLMELIFDEARVRNSAPVR